MATAKKTTVKKTAAKKTAAPRAAARKTAETPPAADDAAVYDAARNLALDFLYKEAFKYGRRPHAARYVEDSSIPREVKTVLLGVIERNES